MNKKRVSANYINNAQFYQAMKDYLASCKEAEEMDDPYPIVPNYIGECFYKIATRLASRPNFYSYSYKEEMIGDAIENCIHYVKSFNPDKSTNPFSYFTQVSWNAFIGRINKEKKQQYVKYKSMEHMVINNSNFAQQVSDVPHIITPEFHENAQSFIGSFEENIEKAKQKKEEKLAEKRALENFIEDDNNE